MAPETSSELDSLPVTFSPLIETLIAALDILLKESAPNAAHDSQARAFDTPRCDEDTRVELINEVMERIEDQESRRMVCMTGSAGSGKSAIAQTICEQCAEKDILGASFFFSVTDPTRNHPGRFIATLAYQLADSIPVVRSHVLAAVQRDPSIFRKTPQAQMDKLIIRPVLDVLSQGRASSSTLSIHAIVIDGLDECSGENNQQQVIVALHQLQSVPSLPFTILLTSRPEIAIRDALEPSGCLSQAVYHLVLNDYDASSDIRGYIRRRLGLVGQRRGLRNWPSERDLNALTYEAAGHFIYAMTVVKFIGERRASPIKRLELVLDRSANGRPPMSLTAPMDTLYRTILEAAKHGYDETLGTTDSDFALRLQSMLYVISRSKLVGLAKHATEVDAILRLEPGDTISFLLDLHSVIHLQEDVDENSQDTPATVHRISVWHKSFLDFLADPSRCGEFGIQEVCLTSYITACAFENLSASVLDGEIAASSSHLP